MLTYTIEDLEIVNKELAGHEAKGVQAVEWK